MLPRIAFGLILGFAALAVAGTKDAGALDGRRRHQINPIPFSHAPCSVFDRRPCTPTFCSVFNHGPCIPEIFYPYGENLQLTVQTVPAKDDEDKYQRPGHDLDTIGDLFAELRSCWSPPPLDAAKEGMQMSVRFSFKRTGAVMAPPFVTYTTPGTKAETKQVYRRAINAALERCAPLPFSKGFSAAIAGQPISIRYVDDRVMSAGSSRP